MNNLQEQYNKLIKKYGEDRIVWIAAAGHSAYEQNFMPGESVTACYLPTEDELRAEIETQKAIFELQQRNKQDIDNE